MIIKKAIVMVMVICFNLVCFGNEIGKEICGVYSLSVIEKEDGKKVKLTFELLLQEDFTYAMSGYAELVEKSKSRDLVYLENGKWKFKGNKIIFLGEVANEYDHKKDEWKKVKSEMKKLKIKMEKSGNPVLYELFSGKWEKI